MVCVRNAKDILAANLRALMDATPALDTPAKLAAAAKWPRGAKAGEHVSPRMILYALTPGRMVPSPTLDLVEAVATALGVQPWELITDPGEARRQLLDRLLRGPTAPDARLGDEWRNPDSPPPTKPRSRRR